MSSPDDLILRAQGGDREAFSQLVRLHQAQLRALTALTVVNREAVLDIVQDAFVDAWLGLPGFDHQRPFQPWLRAICRNRIARYFRERLGRSRECALVDEALLADPQESTRGELCQERLEALRACLTFLQQEHRQLLDWRFGQEWTVSRIAGQLGKSGNAVSMALLRIKQALGECAERRLQREVR
jgi:RNA polymerase sigma-70 factor (ECF subfamily)